MTNNGERSHVIVGGWNAGEILNAFHHARDERFCVSGHCHLETSFYTFESEFIATTFGFYNASGHQ